MGGGGDFNVTKGRVLRKEAFFSSSRVVERRDELVLKGTDSPPLSNKENLTSSIIPTFFLTLVRNKRNEFNRELTVKNLITLG